MEIQYHNHKSDSVKKNERGIHESDDILPKIRFGSFEPIVVIGRKNI